MTTPMAISTAQSKTLVSLYRALTRLAKKFDTEPSAKTLLYRAALSPLSPALPSSSSQSSSVSPSSSQDLQSLSLSLSSSPSHPFASVPSDPLHVTLYYQRLLDSVLGGSRRFLFTPSADGGNASLRSLVQREFRAEHAFFSLNERLDAGFAALRNFSRSWHRHREIERARESETRSESEEGIARAERFLDTLEARLAQREQEREGERVAEKDKESERVKELEREREKERVWARALAQAIDAEREREESEGNDKSKGQQETEEELLLLSHTLRREQALQLIKRERARLAAHTQILALRRERESQCAEKAAPLLARLSVSATPPSSLSAGVVLCAHPLITGALHRTVILLLEHSSAASYGVVLNAPTHHTLRNAVKGLPNEMLRVFQQCDVYAGGPVRRLQWIHRVEDGESVPIPFCSSTQTQTHILTDANRENESEAEKEKEKSESSILGSLPLLFPSFAKTSTSDEDAPLYSGGDISKILSLAKRDRRHVKDKFRFYVGCCCWGPGQLEREMQSGYWTAVQTQPDLLFRLTDKKPLSPIVVKSAADADDEKDLDLDLGEDDSAQPLVDVYELLHRSLGKEHAALARIPEDIDLEQIDSVDWHA